MKLRNKKTGETGYYLHTHRDYKTGVLKVAVLKDGVPFSEFKPYEPIYDYDSLAELEREWEDYEEPKEYWYMDYAGFIHSAARTGNSWEVQKKIGNCFETKEEAEKAVEKLKAYKRLKDRGFKFDGYNACSVDYDIDEQYRKYISQDLDLLFGGEE